MSSFIQPEMARSCPVLSMKRAVISKTKNEKKEYATSILPYVPGLVIEYVSKNYAQNISKPKDHAENTTIKEAMHVHRQTSSSPNVLSMELERDDPMIRFNNISDTVDAVGM